MKVTHAKNAPDSAILMFDTLAFPEKEAAFALQCTHWLGCLWLDNLQQGCKLLEQGCTLLQQGCIHPCFEGTPGLCMCWSEDMCPWDPEDLGWDMLHLLCSQGMHCLSAAQNRGFSATLSPAYAANPSSAVPPKLGVLMI